MVGSNIDPSLRSEMTMALLFSTVARAEKSLRCAATVLGGG